MGCLLLFIYPPTPPIVDLLFSVSELNNSSHTRLMVLSGKTGQRGSNAATDLPVLKTLKPRSFATNTLNESRPVPTAHWSPTQYPSHF
jgi:hypothetical protein